MSAPKRNCTLSSTTCGTRRVSVQSHWEQQHSTETRRIHRQISHGVTTETIEEVIQTRIEIFQQKYEWELTYRAEQQLDVDLDELRTCNEAVASKHRRWFISQPGMYGAFVLPYKEGFDVALQNVWASAQADHRQEVEISRQPTPAPLTPDRGGLPTLEQWRVRQKAVSRAPVPTVEELFQKQLSYELEWVLLACPNLIPSGALEVTGQLRYDQFNKDNQVDLTLGFSSPANRQELEQYMEFLRQYDEGRFQTLFVQCRLKPELVPFHKCACDDLWLRAHIVLSVLGDPARGAIEHCVGATSLTAHAAPTATSVPPARRKLLEQLKHTMRQPKVEAVLKLQRQLTELWRRRPEWVEPDGVPRTQQQVVRWCLEHKLSSEEAAKVCDEFDPSIFATPHQVTPETSFCGDEFVFEPEKPAIKDLRELGRVVYQLQRISAELQPWLDTDQLDKAVAYMLQMQAHVNKNLSVGQTPITLITR